MRHIKTKTAQTILFAGIGLFAFCTSALADMDWKRMKRDLAIQEGILDQFLDMEKGSTTGLYVEKHGVLLIASSGTKDSEGNMLRMHTIGAENVAILQMKRGDKVWHIEKKSDKSSENEEEEILEFFVTSKKPEASQNEKKEQNDAIKKQITEFLSIYGNTIGQLKDDDRVTILLHLKKMQEGFGKQIETFEKKSETSKNMAFKIVANTRRILLEATTTKRDIEAYNRGKIDEQTFQNRITFREHEPQPSRDKRIDIMADILSNTLKNDTDLRFLSGTKSAGFYQKGIGTLFFVSQKDNLFGYDWYKQESDPDRDDGLDALKTSVIETLADYGPTLRDLSPEESIIVHANLIKDSDHKITRLMRMKKDKPPEIKRPDRILFRVAKRDIDTYASQKIDLDTFRKRVAITEM